MTEQPNMGRPLAFLAGSTPVGDPKAWAEIWPLIGPQVEMVMRGEAAPWHENHLVPFIRHGQLQNIYWTYSYWPIDEETAPNGFGGVLVICTETTEHVLAKQHIETDRAQFARLFEQAHIRLPPEQECIRIVDHTDFVGRRFHGRPESIPVPRLHRR